MLANGKCKVGITHKTNEKHVRLECDEIEIVTNFRYLEDMLGKCDSTSKAVTICINKVETMVGNTLR